MFNTQCTPLPATRYRCSCDAPMRRCADAPMRRSTAPRPVPGVRRFHLDSAVSAGSHSENKGGGGATKIIFEANFLCAPRIRERELYIAIWMSRDDYTPGGAAGRSRNWAASCRSGLAAGALPVPLTACPIVTGRSPGVCRTPRSLRSEGSSNTVLLHQPRPPTRLWRVVVVSYWYRLSLIVIGLLFRLGIRCSIVIFL